MSKKLIGLFLAIVLLTGVVLGSVFAVAAGSEGGQVLAAESGSVQIVQQPHSASAAAGDGLTVRVVASGEGLTYKWYYKNPGAENFKYTDTFTGDTYTISSMSASRDGRQIYCVITDKYGNSVTTDTVILRLGAPVKITQQPQSAAGFDAERVTVTVKATGEGLTYQWFYKNAGDTAFALTSTYTTNVYSVPMNASRDGRQIYCVITDKYGNSVTTDTVTLSMKRAVKIEKQPTSVSALDGTQATVRVTASGDGLTYKWYFKDAGKTKFYLTTSFTGPKYVIKMNAERADRQVYCVVTDQYGNSVTTDTVTLKMGVAAQITQQPQSASGFDGERVKVTVGAIGDGLTYKWYYKDAAGKDFALTTTYTTNTYSVPMKASRDGRQIYCVVTDQYGNSVTTDTVTLIMKKTAQITQQPQSASGFVGESVTITVGASGDGLTYKWYFMNPGDSKFSATGTFTGDTYTISSMSASRDGRQIYCVITDMYGNSVTTDTVTLGMKTAVSITKQPASVTVLEDSKATITVGAVGDGLTYKWYFKDANGKEFALTTTYTTKNYTVTVNAKRAGRQVYCVITDKYGNSVQTDVATFNMIHVHKLGNWVVMRQPTPEEEGMERADCSGCDYYEERQIAKIPAVCYITIDLGNGQTQKIGVGSNGIYRLSDPTRIGFNFKGFVDINGKPFAASGTTSKNISIAAVWEIDGTDTLEELLERADLGATDILITADIIVDQPIFVPYVTKIYSDGDFSIIRAPEYEGDIFVLGRNSKNESSVVNHHQACLTLGGGKGTLTIDGNRDNTIITVKGSLIYAGDSSLLKIYDGVRLVNNEKLGNKRALETGTKSTGGAAIAIYNSTVWMYGGVIDNCAVATTATQVVNEDGTVSNHEYNGCGGAIFNRGNFYMYGGEITNCVALRGGAIYNDRYIFLDAGTISYCKAYTYGGAVSSSSSANADTHFGNTTGDAKMRFVGNYSVRAGGAFYSNTNSPLVVWGNTEFIGNHSDSSGGAIYTGGGLTLRGTYFEGNYCNYSGGAIYHHFANADRVRRLLSIEDCVFENNTASLGGAVILSSNVAEGGTYATIKNTQFTGNHALKNEHNAGNGGALYITRYSEATITGCTFTNNEATTNSGAVSIHSSAKVKLSDSDFTGNTAQFGGAMYISSDSQATITNVDFIGNSANCNENGGGGNGGALYLANVDVSLKNINLLNNTAGNNAGAVYMQNIQLELDSTVKIEGNTAGNHGGALYLTYTTNEDGTKSGSRLVLRNMTLKNNTALAGGAISARSASEVVIENVQFTGNSTPGAMVSTENGGGAIYSNNSTVTIKDVTFDGNMSGYYGGVMRLVYCQTVITDSVFTNNQGGTGAVIYAPGGDLTLTDCEIKDNTSSLNSIIYSSAKEVKLRNVTASGNTAVNGGVLYTSGSTVATVENCNWSCNSASSGGAIYIGGNSSVTVTGSTFENNSARGQGGAIYVNGAKLYVGAGTVFTGNTANSNGGAISAIDLVNETTGEKTGSTVTITGAIFTGNTGACGGAVYLNDSTYSITDSQFVGNTATSTSYGGGAVYNTGASGELKRVVLKDNVALRGGAVALYTKSSMTVEDVQAIGNTATADGGAFYNNNCELKLLGEVVLNENTANNGGALYQHNVDMDLTNVQLNDNAALNNGGAVYITGATLNITGDATQISGNTAANYGGVIYGSYVTVEDVKNGATINITGVTLNNNSALYGGVIAGRTNTSINLTDTILRDNNTELATQANEAGGGAIYANNSVLTISGCEFIGNSSGYYGGVIKTDTCQVVLKDGTRFEGNSGATGAVLYLSSGSSMTASDVEVVNNTSETNGLLYLNGTNFDIDKLTATGNSAAWNGGVLYINGGKTNVTVTNSLLKDNTSGSGGAIYVGNGELTLRDTCIEGNSAGKGGAIYAVAGNILLDGTTVLTGNSASDGGAVYAMDKAQVTVDGITVQNNTATGNGGAIYIRGAKLTICGNATFTGNSAATGGALNVNDYLYLANPNDLEQTRVEGFAEITDAVFSNNTAGRGGAVYVNNVEYTVTNVEFSDNIATAVDYGGGAIYSTLGVGQLENVTFTGNSSVKGGAVALHTDSVMSIDSITATGNSAVANADGGYGVGGVFYVNDADLIITDSDGLSVLGEEGKGNAAVSGGVIQAENGAVVNLANVQIEGNSSSQNGGAIYTGNSQVTINGVSFESNTAGLAGGAIYVSKSKITVGGVTFNTNSATVTGGAVYLNASELTNTGDVTFTENTAAEHGGAIYATYSGKDADRVGSVINMTGGSFSGNKAMAGGAVSIRSDCSATFDGTVFAGNSVTGYADKNDGDGDGGGAIYVGYGEVTLINVTATGNTAEGYGGVIDAMSSDVTITGGVYSKNTAGISGGVIFARSGSKVNISGTELSENESTYVNTEYDNSIGGGAVNISGGSLSIKDTALTGNKSGYYGGAVLASGAEVTINGETVISGNTGGTGAALNFKSGCTVVLDGITVNNNISSRNGVIYANGGTLTMVNVNAFENKAVSGGVLYLSGSSTVVTVTDSTFTDNYANNGGVVYMDGPTVTVQDCTLTGNDAENGGAFYENAGNLSVIDGTVGGATATRGGVVYAAGGILQIAGTEISGNTALHGGAVYASQTEITMSGTVVEGNNATANGGAMYVVGCNVTITDNCVFTKNTAADHGGALYVVYFTDELENKLGTVLNMTGGSFIENSALNGGAISGRTNSVINLTNVQFTDNNTDAASVDNKAGGGAIYCNNSQLTLTGCELTGNSSGYYGGVIKTDATQVTLDSTVISGNTGGTGATLHISGGGLTANGLTLTDNISNANGVVYLKDAEVNISDMTATGNSAEWNGGVLYISGTKINVVIADSVIENNTAPSGGAVWIGGGSLRIENTRLYKNSATNGGAVYAAAGSVTLDGCTVSKNTATKEGGAVYSTGAVINTVNGSFAENTAGNGGAIYIESAALTVNGTTFTNNAASNGGAVMLRNEASAEITGANFADNTATSGGAVNVSGATLTILEGTTFTGNTATGNGGGVWMGKYTYKENETDTESITLDATASADGAVFTGNTALQGGAFYVTGCNYTLKNTEFTSNSATSQTHGGGAVYSTSSVGQMDNVTLTGNTSHRGGAVALHTNSVLTVTSLTATGNSATLSDEGELGIGGAFFVGGATLNLNGTDGSIVLGSAESGNTSVSGGGAIRAENNAVVNISGAVFTGNTSSGSGGAVYGINCVLTISDTEFVDNTATSNGGAIYISSSTLVSENNTFTGNSANHGGGVYVSGTETTLNGCTFTENTATSNGGAIYISSGTLVSENNTFTGNSANHGGGVYVTGTETTLDGCTFTENTAASNGGAIYLLACELSGENNNFTSNSAIGHGGAIYVNYSKTTVEEQTVYVPGVLTLTGGAFEENTALAGGAVSVRSYSTATFTGTTFIGNSVTGFAGENDGDGDGGGAIYVGYGTLNMTDVTATGNTAEYHGGVIDAAGATVNVTGGTFGENSAENGGVIYGTSGSKVTFIGATLKDNSSTYDVAVSGYNNSMGGGAINMYSGTLTLDSAILDGNTTVYYGGAVLADKVTVTIKNNTEIKNNTGGTGAALLFRGGCNVTIENSSITGNTATANGVIYANATTMTMTGVTATGNSANSGGVLFVSGSSSVVNVDNCTFRSNSAKNGGAISIDGGARVNVNGGTLDQNTATGVGGAIYVADSSTANTAATKLTMVGVTLSGNTASQGGALSTDTASVNLIIDVSNCTFTGNTSTKGGGAVEIQNGNCASATDPEVVTIVFTNCTFTDNTAGTTGGAIEIRTNSCAKIDGITATGNKATQNGAVVYVTSNFSRAYLTGTVTVSNNTAASGNFMYLYNSNYTNPPKIYTTHSSDAAWVSMVGGNKTNVAYDLITLP